MGEIFRNKKGKRSSEEKKSESKPEPKAGEYYDWNGTYYYVGEDKTDGKKHPFGPMVVEVDRVVDDSAYFNVYDQEAKQDVEFEVAFSSLTLHKMKWKWWTKEKGHYQCVQMLEDDSREACILVEGFPEWVPLQEVQKF